MPDQAPNIDSFSGKGRLVYDKKRRTVVFAEPSGGTEQQAFDEWCPEPYRNRIWTAQAQEAARGAFAAAWYARRHIDKYGLALMMISQGCAEPVEVATRALAKGWYCKACGWLGEMPNTKVLPDTMGTAQTPCCPDCDQHAALHRS